MLVAGDPVSSDDCVVAAYRNLVGAGRLNDDVVQRSCAEALDQVRDDLGVGRARRPALGRINGGARTPVRGAYIWGPVGRGKTLLMDLFFERVETQRRRRVHFLEFMDEVHAALTAVREADRKAGASRPDAVAAVAVPIIAKTRLLCFDEFQVTDIADAMLLGRLFGRLFEAGMVMVATSNTAPDDLYRGGLNRELVLPFIDLLKRRTAVIELDGPTDYRRRKLAGRPIYFFGPATDARKEVDAAWLTLTGGERGNAERIGMFGRSFTVPSQAMGAARFSFAELCEIPLGPRDYLSLARRYHTFVIEDIPTLDRARSDAAKRFITLIDTLYDRRAKLVASFEAQLDDLGADEVTSFEFRRTVSRLIEMQSDDYLSAAPDGAGGG
jgi:cell division protein ZapE